MRGLSIFARLCVSYLLIILIVVSLAAYTTWRFDQLNRITRSISSVDSKIIRLANDIKGSFFSQAGFERKYIVSGDNDFLEQFMAQKKSINSQFDKIGKLISDLPQEQAINSSKSAYENYVTLSEKEFSLVKNDADASEEKYRQSREKLVNKVVSGLNRAVELTKADMDEKIRISQNIGSQALKLGILATLIIIIMGVIIAFYNARTINRPILSLMTGTRRIAQGDFDRDIEISSPPEIQELADSFNYMCRRLQELDRMKSDFVSHVSHELRTPLTSIKESTSILMEGNLGYLSSEQRKLMGIVQEECERLIHSVNRILDLSRIESGMMEFQMEKYNLSSLVEKSVSKVKPIAEKKNLQININIPSDILNGYVDWDKIDQVFVNILGNALKFTPEGGEIHVYAYNRAKEQESDRNMIEVCITDTGSGISEEELPEIFDKFKKMHGKGAGLGLAIAKNILNAHGGEIWAESEPGQGSSFYFTLPGA